VVSRRERTRDRLVDAALELFERQGFEVTTVAQVAAAAGVTEMTYFRHFAAKHGVLFDDPYDPVIVAAVGAQSSTLDPLRRAARGLRQAWAQVPEPEGDVVRRRVRIVAATPSLRGEMWRNNAETERLVAERLVADGAEPLPAKVAAAAVLAGVTAALLEWSLGVTSLADTIDLALDTLEAAGG
jgi:AcrR family transcriptional regulator